MAWKLDKNNIAIIIIIILIAIIFYMYYKKSSKEHRMNTRERIVMYNLDVKLNKIIIYLTKHKNLRYIDFDISKASKKSSAYVLYYEDIYIDPYKKDGKSFYNDNTLFYVALHELTHIIIKSKKHNDHFKNTFLNLLKIAKKLKLLDMSKVEKYYVAVE